MIPAVLRRNRLGDGRDGAIPGMMGDAVLHLREGSFSFSGADAGFLAELSIRLAVLKNAF